MATIRFYRAWHVLDDRPFTADEIQEIHDAAVNVSEEDRVLEGRPKATSEAAPVNGYRWMAVYRIRGSNLPSQSDQTGLVSDLDLPEGTDVAEGTHFALLDNAIVPIIVNSDGASYATIARYLSHASAYEVSLRPIIDPEISAQLDEFGAVNWVRFEVDDLLDEPSGDVGGVGSVLQAARQEDSAINALVFELKWDGDERSAAADSFRQRMEGWMNQLSRHGRVKKAKAKGSGDGGDPMPTVDMLTGHIAASVEVPREDPRRVLRTDAVTAIADAYAQAATQLERAGEDGDGKSS